MKNFCKIELKPEELEHLEYALFITRLLSSCVYVNNTH